MACVRCRWLRRRGCRTTTRQTAGHDQRHPSITTPVIISGGGTCVTCAQAVQREVHPAHEAASLQVSDRAAFCRCLCCCCCRCRCRCPFTRWQGVRARVLRRLLQLHFPGRRRRPAAAARVQDVQFVARGARFATIAPPPLKLVGVNVIAAMTTALRCAHRKAYICSCPCCSSPAPYDSGSTPRLIKRCEMGAHIAKAKPVEI